MPHERKLYLNFCFCFLKEFEKKSLLFSINYLLHVIFVYTFKIYQSCNITAHPENNFDTFTLQKIINIYKHKCTILQSHGLYFSGKKNETEKNVFTVKKKQKFHCT